jgi:hypothetical protein
MRNTDRIKPFLEKFEKLWETIPDLRFSQIYTILVIQAKEKFGIDDIYYLEDDEISEIIQNILDNGEV